jgi:hypothetical protein
VEDIILDQDIDEYIETSEDALFHYTKVSIAIEHILHTKKFRLSLLKDTNDPREYKFKLLSTTWWPSDRDITIDLSDEAQTVIDRILRYECRIMCFCTNKKPILILNDDSLVEDEHACSKGWSKSRMWSQYGQNHHGICLVFSKRELEGILNKIKSQIKVFKASYVQYSQKDGIGWEAIILDGNRLENEGIEVYSFNHVMENSDELFFRKHVDYRDEAEFRVVVFDSNKKLEYLDISSWIKCVIIGDRTPKAYIPLINQMCADLNIESRRAHWDKGKPYLVFCNS